MYRLILAFICISFAFTNAKASSQYCYENKTTEFKDMIFFESNSVELDDPQKKLSLIRDVAKYCQISKIKIFAHTDEAEDSIDLSVERLKYILEQFEADKFYNQISKVSAYGASRLLVEAKGPVDINRRVEIALTVTKP